MHKKRILVAQSGGPTAVINASLMGVVQTAIKDTRVEKVLGALNGIEGLFRNHIVDLSDLSEEMIKKIYYTPSSALGSCRYKLGAKENVEEEYSHIFSQFKYWGIDLFFYIGGNDSMDTVAQLNEYGIKNGFSVQCIGIPKTIDNDLEGTDHTPGYGSAAKYIANSILEIKKDLDVYERKQITIVEIMGRDAGWLTAAAYLPNYFLNDGIDLIYLPEKAFDLDSFYNDVKRVQKEKDGKVFIAISEGIRDEMGQYVGAMDLGLKDQFGHQQLGGAAFPLKQFVKTHLESRVKTITFDLLQRCSASFVSKTDLEEAFGVGKCGVLRALEGESGKMISIVRIKNNPYETLFESVDIHGVANRVKSVPKEYILDNGKGMTNECCEYIAPLINGKAMINEVNGLEDFGYILKSEKMVRP